MPEIGTLAIDLGGTRIKAGVVVGHTVVSQRIVPTEDEKGFERVLQNIIGVGEELLREGPASAVGISLPAVVDVDRGTVLDVRKNLIGLIGFPIAATLGHHFGLPVALENDARLYGLGELVAGAAQGAANVVCLTLGTGIGCCVVQDGHILRGPRGTRGILGGHITIETYGPRCTCGNIGCVEALCSASSLVRATTDRLTEAADHPLRTVQSLTPEAILSAARDGDGLAGEVLADYLRHLAAAVVSYVHAYDPDVVILGGGIMHAADQVLPPIQEFVDGHAWTCPQRSIPVRSAALGDGAAMVGAAALARGEARFR